MLPERRRHQPWRVAVATSIFLSLGFLAVTAQSPRFDIVIRGGRVGPWSSGWRRTCRRPLPWSLSGRWSPR
jgi:hypothetical protein